MLCPHNGFRENLVYKSLKEKKKNCKSQQRLVFHKPKTLGENSL